LRVRIRIHDNVVDDGAEEDDEDNNDDGWEGQRDGGADDMVLRG
jgi:hypothetical protein